jgi:quinol monooxygenase YgiN
MYGSVFTMKVKPGKEQEVARLFERWDEEHLPRVDGAIAAYLLKPARNQGELIAVAVFKDIQSYRANADRPEQDQWFQELRSHLEADPDWHDGEYLTGQPS